MNRIVTSLAAAVAMSGLSGCTPDQEYRLAEACRNSVNYIRAPSDDAQEESCKCMAKAAVQQLDRDTVEFMIVMLNDRSGTDLSNMENPARLRAITEFFFRNDACLTPLTES